MRIGRSMAGLVLIAALAGCGGSGGGEPAGTAGGLEKTEINVGVVPVPSAAPLFIAVERGFFKEEGLSVRTQTIQAPQQVMPQILNGGIDTFLTSYVSLITISDSRVAGLKILTNSQQGAEGISGVVVAADSPVRTPAQLKGRTIAVNTVRALGEVTVSAHLRAAGLTPADVKFVPVNFAEQIAALKAGRVDAAWMTEPYVTAAKEDLGGRVVIDTLSGPTAGLPLDGWAATADWVGRHPKTAAAFQRAMAKAQRIAATDRDAINRIIPTYTQIPAGVAAAMGLGEFTASVDVRGVQKVVDLLAEFQITKTRIDAAQLVAAPPA
ncbi:hypothetical protein Misp01_21990 [Microtetraspora sp. NBRC 13810]|uniref:ABC transporter substrate-binding protein n=1 Tax=Microtetraspora sp. NBRC 13810 TaxID=3030990 RepID=UPI0024A1C9CE|nr:ABC transporter substrate-binding protein [Microtetraspora sp. NBRC 13810]GLW07069.1 hypothetical protein Misp01_21990 [Microtetraspora sp. NBRC 13810]